MKVMSGLGRVKVKRSCVAIGIFDGVHRGHQMLLKAMVKEARRLKAVPVVITFFPHPAHVLSSSAKITYLVSLRHRFKILETLGVKVCIVIRFTRAFAVIEPEVFIRRILVGRLGVQAIFVGEDFRFGKDRRGDLALFKRLGETCGYAAYGVAPLMAGRAPISYWAGRFRSWPMWCKAAAAAVCWGIRRQICAWDPTFYRLMVFMPCRWALKEKYAAALPIWACAPRSRRKSRPFTWKCIFLTSTKTSTVRPSKSIL